MTCELCGGPVEHKQVAYIIEVKSRLHIIENVPARVCIQCGEKTYSPETVKKIQEAIWKEQEPDRVIKMPVIDYVSIR